MALALGFDRQGEGYSFHSVYPWAQVSKSRGKKKTAAAGYFTLLPQTPLCKSLFPPQAGTGEPRQDPSTHHAPPQRARSLHPTQPSPNRRGRGPAGCAGAVGRMMIPFAAWRLRGESAPTGFPSAFSSKAANYFSLGKLAFIWCSCSTNIQALAVQILRGNISHVSSQCLSPCTSARAESFYRRWICPAPPWTCWCCLHNLLWQHGPTVGCLGPEQLFLIPILNWSSTSFSLYF